MESLHPETHDLIPLIRKRLAINRHTTSKELAEYASVFFDRRVSPSEVSKVRDAIGLSRDAIKGQDLSRWYAGQQIDNAVRSGPYTRRRFPVCDVDLSLEFYANLGFSTMRFQFKEASMALGHDQFTLVEIPPKTLTATSVSVVDTISLAYSVYSLDRYAVILENRGYTYRDRKAEDDRPREFLIADPDGRILIVTEAKAMPDPPVDDSKVNGAGSVNPNG